MSQPGGPSFLSYHRPAPPSLRALAQTGSSAWDVPPPPLLLTASHYSVHLNVTSSRKPPLNPTPHPLLLWSYKMVNTSFRVLITTAINVCVYDYLLAASLGYKPYEDRVLLHSACPAPDMDWLAVGAQLKGLKVVRLSGAA